MSDVSTPEFLEILRSRTELDAEACSRVAAFREQVLAENQRQNLTRLLDPQAFFEGHVVDCLELLKSGWIEYPAMDLGSGGGVPGLLCAVLGSGPWVLADSEGHKAAFLGVAAGVLGLHEPDLRVFSGRAEEYLRQERVATIVARAVGPVSRIYGWLRGCSTWNKLLLLKGPGWEEEWATFQSEKHFRELEVEKTYAYTVGAEKKRRVLVLLSRVPRGTR